jgi:transcriptional regulator with XRE-family HTH domain
VTPTETLAANIRTYRRLNDWTQADLAKRVGFKHPSIIAKIEGGNRQVSILELLDLADAFDTTIGFLLDESAFHFLPREIS